MLLLWNKCTFLSPSARFNLFWKLIWSTTRCHSSRMQVPARVELWASQRTNPSAKIFLQVGYISSLGTNSSMYLIVLSSWLQCFSSGMRWAPRLAHLQAQAASALVAGVHFTPSSSPVSFSLITQITWNIWRSWNLKVKLLRKHQLKFNCVWISSVSSIYCSLKPIAKCWKKCTRFHPASRAGCTSAVLMAKLYPDLTFPLFYVPPSIE